MSRNFQWNCIGNQIYGKQEPFRKAVDTPWELRLTREHVEMFPFSDAEACNRNLFSLASSQITFFQYRHNETSVS
jgi:hypothetical protein